MFASTLNQLIGGVLGLKREVFTLIMQLNNGLTLALLVVLLAGISLGIGQMIVLFISRVKPTRFIFSLLLNSILFTFGFLFLVFSTWLICLLGSENVSFFTLIKVLGLSYAPLIFSFMTALPYFGIPILTILSVWRLFAMVVGFDTVTGLGITGGFGYLAFGWVVLQLLENTVGKPIAKFGKKLADRVAGVELAQNNSELVAKVKTGMTEVTSPLITPSSTNISRENFWQEKNSSYTPQTTTSTAAKISQSIDINNPLVELEQRTQNIPQLFKLLLSLLGMVVLFGAIALILIPLRQTLFGWYQQLPALFRFIFNLVWIGVVATIFAGVLAPLETLGWWAGWYDDEIQTPEPTQTTPITNNTPINRYLIYLDGIGQSGEEYTPDVEGFLQALKPTLPQDMQLIKGLMMYSVLNKPLDEDRSLAFLWRMADKMRFKNPAALLGLLLNLRNAIIVAVSADKRYGPIYNQGIAQVLYNGLIETGYQPGSGIPITMIGYSGGGEMSVAAAPYLKRTLGAPIEVISLGGVMSANNNFLQLEHLYHLVGEKDFVEKIGPIIFPGRWQLFPLSYWNRAKRRGKITIFSLGEVGHQVPGGMMDAEVFLPDGRSYLQQTIDVIGQILLDEALTSTPAIPRKISNYSLYQQAAFVHPENYPLNLEVDFNYYRPQGDWIGRLILPQPEERYQVKGVWLEVHHAPPEYSSLVGQTIKLRWSTDARVQQQVKAVTKDVHFSADAEYSSKYDGLIHPTRLNHWRQVDPLESLAGSHPTDDVIVSLSNKDVLVNDSWIYTQKLPLQITGRYYGLVQFIEDIEGTDCFLVKHFNSTSRQFDGPEEVVSFPAVMADINGCFPSTTKNITQNPLNQQGWYIYGAKNSSGQFVVQSLAPRALFSLQPQQVIVGKKQSYEYIRQRCWANIAEAKGKISSVLLSPQGEGMSEWEIGDRALVIHVYGGIGGNKREPAAASPIFFGHFAYGIAEVVREPITSDLRFDISYSQVYTHNIDGLIAGVLHWSRYLGDRQFGWFGVRPICDLLIKFEPFTGYYEINGQQVSPLDQMLLQLRVMTARYRIGDGTGGTYVGPANNCAQDSNQALFASIRNIEQFLRQNPAIFQALLTENPPQARRFQTLIKLGKDLKLVLQPFGGPRSDWEQNEFNLGSTLEDRPLVNLWTGLGSWRTLLPRLASDNIVRLFLKYGATVWVLRTNQIGGYDPDIKPIAPITF